jgi:hypothetical protein
MSVSRSKTHAHNSCTKFPMEITFIYSQKTTNYDIMFTWHQLHVLIQCVRKVLCNYERCWQAIERTGVSKNRIKQLHILPVLHFNLCLTTEYSETTAHFKDNVNTDNQIYVPQPKCTANFRTHCIWRKLRWVCKYMSRLANLIRHIFKFWPTTHIFPSQNVVEEKIGYKTV